MPTPRVSRFISSHDLLPRRAAGAGTGGGGETPYKRTFVRLQHLKQALLGLGRRCEAVRFALLALRFEVLLHGQPFVLLDEVGGRFARRRRRRRRRGRLAGFCVDGAPRHEPRRHAAAGRGPRGIRKAALRFGLRTTWGRQPADLKWTESETAETTGDRLRDCYLEFNLRPGIAC